jgi:hypothetical protein
VAVRLDVLIGARGAAAGLQSAYSASSRAWGGHTRDLCHGCSVRCVSPCRPCRLGSHWKGPVWPLSLSVRVLNLWGATRTYGAGLGRPAEQCVPVHAHRPTFL